MKLAYVRKSIRNLGFAVAALTAGVFVAAPAAAVPITSASTLTTNGLSFNNFTCSITKTGVLSQPNNCNQIQVATNGALPGIDITSNFFAFPASMDTATLTFQVSAATGISAISLGFDGAFAGLSIASVRETVRDAFGNVVGSLFVSCSVLVCDTQDPSLELFDIALNGTYNTLFVTKEINVTGAAGIATIGRVQQGFTVAQVPEPGSLALLGLGILAAGGARRRARKVGAAA
ncbi:PEP-CTERM sorting domain-containing protein [uncultured Massilia sp.]|uniref:PEP-CTERM sorting domain-containing protein n=1 Tax=uncultured Massilia sp. TaxID=169973 RepID=UPI0026006ED8|nr:PEP-CTERM sorting domain-containing protein [uncultured Massilia sp.]